MRYKEHVEHNRFGTAIPDKPTSAIEDDFELDVRGFKAVDYDSEDIIDQESSDL